MVKFVEKTGRSGRFVVAYNDAMYSNQKGELLAINHGSSVARRIMHLEEKPAAA